VFPDDVQHELVSFKSMMRRVYVKFQREAAPGFEVSPDSANELDKTGIDFLGANYEIPNQACSDLGS
jgi:hypothetical protein